MANNPAEETVEIHWAYIPADFFGEKAGYDCGDYSVKVEGGHATARMGAAFYKQGRDFQNTLTEELRNYFHVWQLDRRRAFEIRGPSVRHIHPDGTGAIIQVVNELVCTLEPQPCNPILAGPDGVVHEPRRERFETTKNRACLWLCHASDLTARRMLESYDRAVREPEQVLMRLYEVWEAVAQAFGGKKNKARDVLGISYSRLEALANDKRLKQGRHSGRFVGPQRDATAAELDEAWRIAREMIEKYLNHLSGLTRLGSG